MAAASPADPVASPPPGTGADGGITCSSSHESPAPHEDRSTAETEVVGVTRIGARDGAPVWAVRICAVWASRKVKLSMEKLVDSRLFTAAATWAKAASRRVVGTCADCFGIFEESGNGPT